MDPPAGQKRGRGSSDADEGRNGDKRAKLGEVPAVPRDSVLSTKHLVKPFLYAGLHAEKLPGTSLKPSPAAHRAGGSPGDGAQRPGPAIVDHNKTGRGNAHTTTAPPRPGAPEGGVTNETSNGITSRSHPGASNDQGSHQPLPALRDKDAGKVRTHGHTHDPYQALGEESRRRRTNAIGGYKLRKPIMSTLTNDIIDPSRQGPGMPVRAVDLCVELTLPGVKLAQVTRGNKEEMFKYQRMAVDERVAETGQVKFVYHEDLIRAHELWLIDNVLERAKPEAKKQTKTKAKESVATNKNDKTPVRTQSTKSSAETDASKTKATTRNDDTLLSLTGKDRSTNNPLSTTKKTPVQPKQATATTTTPAQPLVQALAQMTAHEPTTGYTGHGMDAETAGDGVGIVESTRNHFQEFLLGGPGQLTFLRAVDKRTTFDHGQKIIDEGICEAQYTRVSGNG